MSANNEDIYLVWSNEHRAWWRPRAQGYTVHLEAAGRFSREEAIKHSRGGDQYRGQPLPELPIREADLMEILAPNSPQESVRDPR